jgi:hypothetical protein
MQTHWMQLPVLLALFLKSGSILFFLKHLQYIVILLEKDIKSKESIGCAISIRCFIYHRLSLIRGLMCYKMVALFRIFMYTVVLLHGS